MLVKLKRLKASPRIENRKRSLSLKVRPMRRSTFLIPGRVNVLRGSSYTRAPLSAVPELLFVPPVKPPSTPPGGGLAPLICPLKGWPSAASTMVENVQPFTTNLAAGLDQLFPQSGVHTTVVENRLR